MRAGIHHKADRANLHPSGASIVIIWTGISSLTGTDDFSSFIMAGWSIVSVDDNNKSLSMTGKHHYWQGEK
jgi:hypothetical protein